MLEVKTKRITVISLKINIRKNKVQLIYAKEQLEIVYYGNVTDGFISPYN